MVRRLPLSLPIVAVGIGFVAPHGPWLDRASGFLLQERVLEHLVEFVVLIALMGAGLRIDRPFGWHRWQATWRLLGIAMPLTIAAMAVLCWAALGLTWAAALLVAAALAPTDPVLACDVQVGPPGEEEGGEVRFALTSEAGLNDGLAFPFVVLAMTLATTPLQAAWVHWLAIDVVWKIGCSALIGFVAGRVFGWLTFRLPRLKLSRAGDELVAVGVTLISYGVTELASSYGFVAVFIAAVTLRATDRSSDFHGAMAEFSEQIERVLMVVVLLVFGVAVATGAPRPAGMDRYRGRRRPAAGHSPALRLDQPDRHAAATRRPLADGLLRHSWPRHLLLHGLCAGPDGVSGRWPAVGDRLFRGPGVDPAARRRRDAADGLGRPPAQSAGRRSLQAGRGA